MMTPLHWTLAAAVAIGVGLGAYGLAAEATKPSVAQDTQSDLPAWLRVLPNSPVAGAGGPVAPLNGAEAPGALTWPVTPVTPAAATAPGATPAPAPSLAALSVQVAPGVHVTPLSVPAGTVPEPAGPRPGDSEPEEN